MISIFNQTMWSTLVAAVQQKPGNDWIVIPAFSWSDVGLAADGSYRMIQQYNLTTTGNFTIKQPLEIDIDANSIPTLLLAIRYRVDETCYRYRLTPDSTQHHKYFNYPAYNGEVIKKNCVFELWAVLGYTNYVSNEVNIPISIKEYPAVENADVTARNPIEWSDSLGPVPLIQLQPTINDIWLDNV